MQDGLRLVHAGGLPVGEVPADRRPATERRQSGKPQASRPRRAVQAHRGRHRRGVDQADAHLLLVLLGPVDPPRPRRRGSGDDADRNEDTRGPRGAGHEVENGCGQPCAHRQLDESRMQWVAQGPAVQDPAQPPQRQSLDGALQRLGDRVELFGPTDGVQRLQGPDTEAVAAVRADGTRDTRFPWRPRCPLPRLRGPG